MSKLIKYTNTIKFDIPVEYKHVSGIYKIINTVTDQIYIGRTKDFYTRYLEHRLAIRYGKCNFKFKLLMLKYNEVHFIMKLLKVTEDIVNEEEYYIKTLDSVTHGLNIAYNDVQQQSPTFRIDTKALPEYKEYLSLLRRNKKQVISKIQEPKSEKLKVKSKVKCTKVIKKIEPKIEKKTVNKELKKFKRLLIEMGYEIVFLQDEHGRMSSLTLGKIKFMGKITKMTKIRKSINYTITSDSDFSSPEVLEFVKQFGLKIEMINDQYKFYIKNYTGELCSVNRNRFIKECQLYEYDSV